ncbi:MAG TPA: replication initiation factor domain-containing protein [Symbiobacteriaceae bacterium]|nr:replication initiation factor domain-containing protein [Symbiobacteriaceae bacterium]
MKKDASATVLIDWVSATYEKSVELSQVLEAWTAENELQPWSKGVGAYGYRGCLKRDDIKVFHDGLSHMGIHVQVSGEGCRQAEAEGLIPQNDWQAWFKTMLAESPSAFARIHVAFDSRSGAFTVRDIKRKGEKGLLVTAFKKGLELLERDLQTGKCTGEGYILGKNSDTQVVFYDKGAESGENGPWVRVELRMKGKNAQELARHLAEHGLSGIAGILRRYVDVKKAGRNKQKSRLKSEKWWDEFLESAERMTLSVNPYKREKKNPAEWVKKSDLRELIEKHDGDVGPLLEMLGM